MVEVDITEWDSCFSHLEQLVLHIEIKEQFSGSLELLQEPNDVALKRLYKN